MKYYYIYIHICLVTAKAYIGWSANPKRRWIEHCAAKDNRPFYNAIRKYGRECFESQIIYRTVNLEEVKQKEIEFIKQFETQIPNGYNITPGGDGGGKKHTEEWKKNKSEQMKGKQYAKGSKRTKEYLEKRKGYKHTEETKEKLRKARKGRKPNLGHKCSEEVNKKKGSPGNKHNLQHGRCTKESKINCLELKIEQLEKKLKGIEDGH